MKKGFISLGLAFVLALAVSAPGQDKAGVFVVHGVPGADVGAADTPFFPVDILVNDILTIRNLELGNVMGPIELDPDPASHKVTIRRANPLDPGTGELVLEAADLVFGAGRNFSIVAHLNGDGSGAALSVFENTFGPAYRTKTGNAGRNKPRLIIHHTAAVDPVDVRVTRENPGNQGGPKLDVEGVENDGESQVIADLLPGTWIMWVGRHQNGQGLYGPWQLELRPFTTYLIYSVGSVENGTFWLIKYPVGVHPKVALRGKDSKQVQVTSSPRKTIKRTFRRY